MIAFLPMAQAGELPAPSSAVVLTITGPLEHPNVGDELQLDMDTLESLPATRFTTLTPWHDEPQQFTGVRLSTLLKSIDSTSNQFVAVGLDDYKFTVADLDFNEYPVIIAYRHNGEPISVRNLGPLRIIMPYSEFPELRTQINESRSVWQLVKMELL
ncbi:molybdopterin-dependent oxidoreductase [Granulosicoccus antarcticus]|nr:molybdopterin-dependent oxidoreductase [Granulosicoccus antarcticus]